MKANARRVATVAFLGALVLSPLIAAAALPSLLTIWNFLRGDFLSVSEVCRRWGERPLDVMAFRSAQEHESIRAAMACSLLKNQDDYVGMQPLEIRSLFGSPDGYYHTESQPAYLIEVAKTRTQDTWQIVFRVDGDWKISDVVVHKNCC